MADAAGHLRDGVARAMVALAGIVSPNSRGWESTHDGRVTTEDAGLRRKQATAVVRGSHASTFGAILRRARARKGVSLEQIHRETKIPLQHLDALEHGILSALPGGVYRRNETRAYARMVGLDPNLALAALERGLEALGLREIPRRESRLPTSATTRLLIVIALVTAAALALSALPSGARLPTRDARIPADGPPPRHAAETRPPPAPRPADVIPAPRLIAIAPERPRDPEPVAALAADTIDSGQLVVITMPEGARLTVDGIGRGTTPLTIRHLPFGDRQVRITKAGYGAVEQVARLDQVHTTRTIVATLSLDSRVAPTDSSAAAPTPP
jgi:hypothetical protein